jgi:hypothetical protein
MTLYQFSQIALANWNNLDAKDRARVKLNFRAWIADTRAARLGV